jgi:aspartate kinase
MQTKELKVLKFGGSSLSDAAQIRKAEAIIRSDPANRFVVVSAPGKRSSGDTKVTDLLYRCNELAQEGQDISEAFGAVAARYRGIIADLGLSLSLEEELAEIRAAIAAGAGANYAASRGEYLNAKVVAALLGYAFLDARDCIFFDERGDLDTARTYKALPDLLKQAGRAVIPGFYGEQPDGSIRTFTRGGSDITGSIVARAAEASVYENWTDVSGMLMADPHIVDDPRVIERVTYRELRELAYMGATVMHDEAIFPVREVGIPINIRNTNDPAAPGTWIVADAQAGDSGSVITGIAGRGGFRAITIEKDRMNNEIGFGRRVLQVFEDYGISFEHMPSGIDTISVVVADAKIAGRENEIISRIFESTASDVVRLDDALALIAVVGRGMTSTKGTAGRIFTAIANAGINIRMIDQGSSEDNIIVGVGDADYPAAIRAIYNEFIPEA